MSSYEVDALVLPGVRVPLRLGVTFIAAPPAEPAAPPSAPASPPSATSASPPPPPPTVAAHPLQPVHIDDQRAPATTISGASVHPVQPFSDKLSGARYTLFSTGGPGAPPTQLDPAALANWTPTKADPNAALRGQVVRSAGDIVSAWKGPHGGGEDAITRLSDYFKSLADRLEEAGIPIVGGGSGLMVKE